MKEHLGLIKTVKFERDQRKGNSMKDLGNERASYGLMGKGLSFQPF